MSREERLTPHGPGFSFLDRLTVSNDRQSAVGEKMLRAELPFFQDHFPGRPLMPGVLLIEAAAQTAGGLWGARLDLPEQVPFALVRVDKFKLSRPVLPESLLRTDIKWLRDFGPMAEFESRLYVGGHEVASGMVVLARMTGSPPPDLTS